MSSSNIFDEIVRKYHDLSRAERCIADCVLKEKGNVQRMSISELAKASGVSDASITRFCHRLGLGSYPELKLKAVRASAMEESAMKDEEGDLYSEIMPEDPVMQKCLKLHSIGMNALYETLAQVNPDALTQAADMLFQARQVFCFGHGSASMSYIACGRFNWASPKFHHIENLHSQLAISSILTEEDVVLFFSYSGNTPELQEVAREVKISGAKLILITRFPGSLGATKADLVLICGANETPLQQGSIAVKISELFIIDILFFEYCARDPEAARHAQLATQQAITAHFHRYGTERR